MESLYARFSAEPDVEPLEETEEEQPDDYEDAPEGTRNFTFVVKDGEIYYCEKNKLIPQLIGCMRQISGTTMMIFFVMASHSSKSVAW